MPLRIRATPRQSLLSYRSISNSNCNFYGSVPVLRLFSTSAQLSTRQRQLMWTWLENQGRNFLNPLPGSTNYLGAYNSKGQLKRSTRDNVEDDSENRQSAASIHGLSNLQEPLPKQNSADFTPFPRNPHFRSQAVVNEAMREAIWEKIMKDGQSVKTVSAELGVEMSRVGAIVRLKEVEKEWIRKGKQLARPYAKAVMSMLPQTPYPYDTKNRTPQAHESINDLPVHAATKQQIFYPTSESREFTRTDAAKVFDETLLPADRRVPHPELAELEKDRLDGMPHAERIENAQKRKEEAMRERSTAEQRRKEREEKTLKVINGARWNFRFREITVDDAGATGRGRHGTGWRYGVPLMDRRKGEVKIPTKVE